MKKIEIYTDGSCLGNPGPGGWAAWMKWSEHEKAISGAEAHTTNNRMELMAAIQALSQLNQSCEVDLYTDSQYVQKGISLWLPKWKEGDWKIAIKKAIKNLDLWQALDKQVERHQVRWHWVKAHCGNPLNEKVDQLAKDAIKKYL